MCRFVYINEDLVGKIDFRQFSTLFAVYTMFQPACARKQTAAVKGWELPNKKQAALIVLLWLASLSAFVFPNEVPVKIEISKSTIRDRTAVFITFTEPYLRCVFDHANLLATSPGCGEAAPPGKTIRLIVGNEACTITPVVRCNGIFTFGKEHYWDPEFKKMSEALPSDTPATSRLRKRDWPRPPARTTPQYSTSSFRPLAVLMDLARAVIPGGEVLSQIIALATWYIYPFAAVFEVLLVVYGVGTMAQRLKSD